MPGIIVKEILSYRYKTGAWWSHKTHSWLPLCRQWHNTDQI